MRVNVIEIKVDIEKLKHEITCSECDYDNNTHAHLMMSSQTLAHIADKVDYIAKSIPTIGSGAHEGIFSPFPNNKVYIDNDLPFGVVDVR